MVVATELWIRLRFACWISPQVIPLASRTRDMVVEWDWKEDYWIGTNTFDISFNRTNIEENSWQRNVNKGSSGEALGPARGRRKIESDLQIWLSKDHPPYPTSSTFSVPFSDPLPHFLKFQHQPNKLTINSNATVSVCPRPRVIISPVDNIHWHTT